MNAEYRTSIPMVQLRRFFLTPAICIIAGVIQAVSASNPSSARKQAIQGTYLADVSSMMGGIDEVHQYGKYVIKGEIITSYSWNKKQKSWVKVFSAPYRLVYFRNADYMTGYNIVFQSPYGYEVRMCTGDVNGDGKMDLWNSDSIFYTKQ